MARDWLPMSVGHELARCQRYYCKTFSLDVAPAQAVGLNTAGALFAINNGAATPNGAETWKFPVNMRAAPTVTTYNPTQANANWRNIGDSGDQTVTVRTASDTEVALTGSAGSANQFYHINAAASAEL